MTNCSPPRVGGLRTRTVPALSRGLDVLELLSDGVARTAPEITQALGLPRTTVHELVRTLLVRGYLRLVEGGSRYRLGIRAFELGRAYEANLDLREISHRVASRVGDECGETVHVAVLDGREVVYIAQVQSRHAVQLVSAPGRRLPAHLTAVGKVLLASLQPEEFAERYRGDPLLVTMTPTSIASVEALRHELDDVRAAGVAWDRRESNPDVFCVAAAIYGHASEVRAAISISVPMHRWNDDRANELARLVVSGAQEASVELGWVA